MLKIMFLFFLAIIPRLGFIDFVIICSIFIVLFDYINFKKFKANVNFLKVVFFIIFLFPTSFIAFSYNQDFFGIVRLVKLLLLLLLIPIVLNSIDENVFHRYFPIFLLIMVLILYLEYFNIFGARMLISQVHDFLHHGRDVSYRAKGLFAGYSAAGVSCGFISIYALFYTFNKRIASFQGWTLFILSFLATFFTARTGIVVSFLGFIAFFVFNYKALLNFKYVLYSCLSVVCAFSIIYSFSDFFDMENIEITFIRTFEIFLNYESKGDMSSESTTQLMNTMALPSEVFELFFGNGYQPWSKLSIDSGAHQTDSGIFQTLFLYGMLGFFLYYIPIFYIFLKSFGNNLKGTFIYSYYLVSVIPIAFVSEVKGHYIYSNLIFVLITFPFFLDGGFLRKNGK